MGYGIIEWICVTIIVMKCPVDNTELKLKTQEKAFGYCCSHCDGVLIDSKGVKEFKHNFNTNILEKSFNNIKVKSSEYYCPSCSENMEYSDIGDMEVLICKKCTSAFF